MSLIKIKDTLTPDLRKRAAAAADKRPLLLAMGTAVVGLGKDAFTDAQKRPAYWDPRKDDKPHPLLLESGTLEASLRGDRIQGDTVFISSSTPYAATHQLGRDHIPARPFLPFHKSGEMTALGRTKVQSALTAALRVRGL